MGLASTRIDAAKKLRCRAGYKQEGSACKPISNKSESLHLPTRSGATLALSVAQNSPRLYGDFSSASKRVNVDGLQKIPAGSEPSKDLVEKAEKNFKRGEMVRKGFDPTFTGSYAYHYGIYAEKNKLIEVDGSPFSGYRIKESPLYKREFIPTTEYELVPDIPKSKDPVADRKRSLSLARAMIGTPFSYDLVDSNCESFARSVYYGKAETNQSSALSLFTRQVTRDVFLQPTPNQGGLDAKEINNILKEKGRDPSLVRAVFRANRTDSIQSAGVKNSLWTTIRSPEEFEREVARLSKDLSGASKSIVEIEAYKIYLIALFGLLSSKAKESSRVDAVRKLKCKPGFKQQGAVCKPVKQGAGEGKEGSSSGGGSGGGIASALKVIPAGVTVGVVLGAIGTAGSIIGEDVKNVAAKDVSHLEMAPIGKDFNKEAIAAEYDKKFEKGDLIRSAFPLEFDKSKMAYHYAIYAGNGEVIESAPDKAGGAGILRQFAHDPNAKSQTTKYEKVELPSDKGSSPIKSKKQTLELAESMVGIPFKWNVIESNCESFARTVAYGSSKGAQSEKVSAFGIKAVTSLIDIVDKVALGGVINRGYHSDDIKKILEQNNYNPELIKSVFKQKKEERQKEIEAKSRKDAEDKIRGAENPYEDFVDPATFTRLVQNTSDNFSGTAKTVLESEMFKTYLVALFTAVSKPKEDGERQDSLALSLSPEQIMQKAAVQVARKTYGGISEILKITRSPVGLISVYFHPLDRPLSVIRMRIGNSVTYKDVTGQRMDSSSLEPQSTYISGLLSTYARIDAASGKTKKCSKGIPCKGACISRTSTCEVELEKSVDQRTIQNLDPVGVGESKAAGGEEDIYAMMNIRDLKEEARKKGVLRYSYMTREQLQSAIKVHNETPDHQEVIRKSLQRQKDLDTLKKVKTTQIGRALTSINPSLGRSFNLLSAIGKKYEGNRTEALIYAIPALIGITKGVSVALQKQRSKNIKESAGAAVAASERYREDIDENTNPEGVNFFVGGYGRGSEDLYRRVSESQILSEDNAKWIKERTEDVVIKRSMEENAASGNTAQAVGDNITTGYKFVVENTYKRGASKESVELAARLYAEGTTWRGGADGVLSIPPIQILAAEDGGLIARDAIEILQLMPRDTATKITGKQISDRIKLITLGTPYLGDSKADIPEINFMGDGDPWSTLPFNKGNQTKRVTGVNGYTQADYTNSPDAMEKIFQSIRSGLSDRRVLDRKTSEEVEAERKRAEKRAGIDNLVYEELSRKAGGDPNELDRLIKDPKAYEKASRKVQERIRVERNAAGFASRRVGLT